MEQISVFNSDDAEKRFHARVEPALLKVLEDNNIQPHHLVFDRKQSYSSCVYKASKADDTDQVRGGVIYRVCLRKKLSYVSVKACYQQYIPETRSVVHTSDGYIRISISGENDCTELLPMLISILDAAIELCPKEFDCCSRYNECSAAKKCIHPDPEFALNCSYKYKLKHGIIYFGENRNVD